MILTFPGPALQTDYDYRNDVQTCRPHSGAGASCNEVQTCLPQRGAGASFVLVLIDPAEARQVHAAATTRTAVLTARFMVFLLTCGSPGSGNP